MAITLADMRKQRTSNQLESITAALNKKTSYANEDEGLYKLERDKAGNGSAVIRPLPAHPDDALPWVQYYSHNIKHPQTGKWYIENCPTTVGRDECPACKANKDLYATKLKQNIDLAKSRSRKLNCVSNIQVKNDSKHPELNGTVMEYKYGKSIFDMWMDKIQPKFEDETPVNVFDLWEGADFKLRIYQDGDFGSYDKSEFLPPSPVADTDEEILEVVNKQKSLARWLDPSRFKSAEELQKSWDRFNGTSTTSTAKAEQTAQNMREAPQAMPKAPKSAPVVAPTQDFEDANPEEMEDYFAKLAAGEA